MLYKTSIDKLKRFAATALPKSPKGGIPLYEGKKLPLPPDAKGKIIWENGWYPSRGTNDRYVYRNLDGSVLYGDMLGNELWLEIRRGDQLLKTLEITNPTLRMNPTDVLLAYEEKYPECRDWRLKYEAPEPQPSIDYGDDRPTSGSGDY
jgi:hypothetical protein